MSKHDQTHFLDKLRRTVEPSPQQSEPKVWFRERFGFWRNFHQRQKSSVAASCCIAG